MQTQTLMESQTEQSQQTANSNLEILDLTALARNVVCDYAAVVKSHPLRFEGDCLCPVLGDRERLTRMLLNLLSNAVKYSAAGRAVTVSVWQSDSTVCLTVADCGVGIPTAEVERLFLPYRRLDKTLDTTDGRGRGLVVVQNIVQAHGGTISVQGAPERGTTFDICFKKAMGDPAA
jgi:signal transduction histidine kinase